MRTFFSVAALVGLSAAQNYQFNPWGNNGYPTPTPTPDPEPEDTRPEDCKEKTDELETQLEGIETECDTSKNSLAMLQAMLDAKSSTINPLVQGVNTNESTIKFCETTNTQQQALIDSLGTRLTAL